MGVGTKSAGPKTHMEVINDFLRGQGVATITETTTEGNARNTVRTAIGKYSKGLGITPAQAEIYHAPVTNVLAALNALYPHGYNPIND